MAPPTKLTPVVQSKICDVIRAGGFPESAAIYAGICSKTFRRWMERGRKARSGPFAAFVRAIDKAERDCEIALTATVRRSAQRDWRAASFLLERRHRDRWQLKERVEVSGSVHHGGGIVLLPPEDPDPAVPATVRMLTEEERSEPSLP